MSTLGQIGQMARRSILQTVRQPAMVIPPIVFPLLLVSINSAGLDAATKIPGFPSDSYWDFAIAVPFIQGSLFAAINAGSSLARDVETGFLKRLAMTPMKRTALLVGQLIGSMVVAFVSACVYLLAGLRRRNGLQVGRARRAHDHRAGGPDRARVRRARRLHRTPLRLGRGGPGLLPAPVRPALPELGQPAAGT